MPKLVLIRAFTEKTSIATFKTVEACQERLAYHIEKFKQKWFAECPDKFWLDDDPDDPLDLKKITKPTVIAGHTPIELGGEKNVLIVGLEYEP